MARRMIALLVFVASLGAQDAERPVVKVYDLGALAPTARGSLRGGPSALEDRAFSLPCAYLQEDIEGLDVPEEEPSNLADMVEGLLKGVLGRNVLDFEVEPVDGGRRILVRARASDQKLVARVIEELRAPGDPPVEIDVRHFSILDRALDDAGKAALAAPGRLEAEQLAALARLDARGGRRGGTLQVVLGRWGVYSAVRHVRYVPDFDAEVAQAAAISDPVTAVATEGLKAAVRPLPLRDGRLLLRIVASAGDLDGGEPRRFSLGAPEFQDSLRLRNTDLGEVEQCDYRGGVVSTEAVVVPGKTVGIVLAAQTSGDVRYDVLTFTIKAAPRAAVGETFVVAPVGALVTADAQRLLYVDTITGELVLMPDGEVQPRISGDMLLDKVRFEELGEGEFNEIDPCLYGGSLLLRGKPARLAAAQEGILALERELIRPALLEIRLVAERQGGESRTVGQLSLPVTADRWSAMAAYRRLDTVGDQDVEIAQEARIADPIRRTVTAGVFANAVLYLNTDGAYRAHVGLMVIGMPQGIQVVAAKAGGIPLIQNVPVSKRTESLTFDVAPGRARTVDLGADPFMPGEQGRLVATIAVQ